MTGGEEKIPLCGLEEGGGGIVAELAEAGITPRLKELGFSVGARVECVGKSPIGGMGAYRLRGSVIALRREDAGAVLVRKTSSSVG